ncbi:MAG: helix-turn-helix domain-containing protein [Firmicutes bacterium]|nr:helix-turn-helix domain-containing protein [Bacillota bacterium]
MRKEGVDLSDFGHFNGIRLKQLRKERGYTQDRLAELAGVSVSHVSQLEKGTRKSPAVDLVYRLAEALSVSVYALLESSESSAAIDRFTTGSDVPLTAEKATQWQRFSHQLRPEVAEFLLEKDGEAVLSFAKALYDARTSSKRVFQLVNDFLSHYDTDSR